MMVALFIIFTLIEINLSSISHPLHTHVPSEQPTNIQAPSIKEETSSVFFEQSPTSVAEINAPTPVEMNAPTPVEINAPSPIEINAPTPVERNSPTTEDSELYSPTQLKLLEPAPHKSTEKEIVNKVEEELKADSINAINSATYIFYTLVIFMSFILIVYLFKK
jgi:hypothetical protein